MRIVEDTYYSKNVLGTDFQTGRRLVVRYRESVTPGYPNTVIKPLAYHVRSTFYNGSIVIISPGEGLQPQIYTSLHYGFNLTDYIPSFRDILISRAASKVDTFDFSAAMAWMERKDTFSMIISRAGQLTSAARAVRKGKFRSAGEILGVQLSQRKRKRLRSRNRIDQFQDNWLEYRYGWTPLLSDIENAAGLITEHINDIHPVISVRTSLKKTDSFVVSQGGYIHEGVVSRREGIGLNFRVKDADYRAREKLGLNNPALIAWELVPFSFVADWFIPISDSLKSYTAFNGLTFVSGYTNCKVSVATNRASYEKGNLKGSDPSYRGIIDDFSRTPLSSFTNLRINPFQTRNGLNAVRCIDSIALLRSVLRR